MILSDYTLQAEGCYSDSYLQHSCCQHQSGYARLLATLSAFIWIVKAGLHSRVNHNTAGKGGPETP